VNDERAAAAPGMGADAPSGSDWRRLLIGAVFVVAVVGAFSYVMTEPSEPDELRALGRQLAFRDDFERPDDDFDLNADNDDWTALRGAWGRQLGAAFVSFAETGANLAVVDPGAPPTVIAATVGGRAPCGVALRVEDPDNFLALVRVPGFAAWNVVEVIDGESRNLGNVPDVAEHDVRVSLGVADNVIRARVGVATSTIAHATPLDGVTAGLMTADGSSDCTFDDVEISVID
jgi:hypothetical protein